MKKPHIFLKTILGTLFTCAFILNASFAKETTKPVDVSNNCEFALELSLFQADSSPKQYCFYSVVATLDNVGPEAIGDIVIDFSRPNGVVYQGDDPFSSSLGTFAPHGSQEWKIDELPSGARATLTVNYFLLSETAQSATIDIVSCFGDSGSNFADLSISNLDVPNPEVELGQILEYNFDLSNTGIADVTGDFNVKSYISRDPFLSNDDTQDGTIPTGNFIAGFEIRNVGGASTIPTNLAAGEYFLIAKIDGDNQIAETDEENNIVSFPITIIEVAADPPAPSNCSSEIISGTLQCTSVNSENELVIITNHNEFAVQNTVEASGQINSEIIGTEILPRFFQFEQGFLKERVDNFVVSEIPVPTSLTNNFDNPQRAIEIEGGFIVLAFNNTFEDDIFLDEAFVILTDSNLNPVSSNFIGPGGLNTGATGSDTQFLSLLELPNNTFRILLRRRAPGTFALTASLIIVDQNLNIISEAPAATDFFSSERQLACGTIERRRIERLTAGISRTTTTIFAFTNDELSFQSDVQNTLIPTGLGTGRRELDYNARTNNGGIVSASHQQNVGGPFNGVIDQEVTIEKRNSSGEIVFQETIELPNPNLITQLIEVDGNPILILQNDEGVELVNINCLLDSNTNTEGADLNLDLVLSNENADIFTFYDATFALVNEGQEKATNIVVDVPTPDGVVYRGGLEFETDSGTFSPYGDQKWRVLELEPGEEVFLTINYFTLQALVSPNYAQVIQMDQNDVDSTPGNGACCVANEDDEVVVNQRIQGRGTSNAIVTDEIPNYPIELKSISPNPTFPGPIEVQIFSKDPESRTLHCYNTVGGLEYTFDVNLESGWNTVQLDVSKLIAGMYIMELRGLNWRQPPVRFIVVGD